MARARTKKELVSQGEETFNELIVLIETIPKEQIDDLFQFEDVKETAAHWKRDKNVKDVLIHLYEWHRLLLNWVESNQNGIETPFLQEGYNWRTYGEMNKEFVKQHLNTSFDEAISLVKESHLQVMRLVPDFSEEELFSKNIFKWVGGSTLGGYFVSSTSSHYLWAIKKIKKHKKSL